jgi:PAS domain-containing protein
MLVRAEGPRRVILATSDLDPGAVRRLAGRRLGDDEVRLVVPPPLHREIELPGETGLRLLFERVEAGEEGEEVLRHAAPLVGRAWRLTDTLASSQRHQAWTSALLERLPTGVLVLDPSARVLQANDAARRRLSEQSQLSIARGILRADSPSLQRSLAEVLARAARFERRGAVSETVLLKRPEPAGPLELLMVGSPRFADGNPEAVAVALAFDPRRAEENPAEVLARRFFLGFEETQIISLLLHGHDIPAIAATLDLPQIGTTRQVELVKLLLTRCAVAA